MTGSHPTPEKQTVPFSEKFLGSHRSWALLHPKQGPIPCIIILQGVRVLDACCIHPWIQPPISPLLGSEGDPTQHCILHWARPYASQSRGLRPSPFLNLPFGPSSRLLGEAGGGVQPSTSSCTGPQPLHHRAGVLRPQAPAKSILPS